MVNRMFYIKVGSMYLENFDVNVYQIQNNFIDNFVFTTIKEHAYKLSEDDAKELVAIIANLLNVSLYDIYILDGDDNEKVTNRTR